MYKEIYTDIELECPIGDVRTDSLPIGSNKEYLRIIANECSGEVRWVTARSRGDDSLIATMAFISKKGKYGSIVAALPFFNTNSFIYPDKTSEQIDQMLITTYQEYAQRENALTTTIVSSYSGKQGNVIEKYFKYSSKQERYTYITQLPDNPEELIKRLPGNKRRNIRKAERLGIEVNEESGEKDRSDFYTIYKRNMNQIGALPKTEEYFQQILDQNSDVRGKLLLARLDDKIIAGLLVVCSGGICEYIAPAIDNEYRDTQCLSMIIYEAMKDMIKNNIREWNWGGCQKDQIQLIRFKKGWNAVEETYAIYINTILPKYGEINSALKEEYKYFFIAPPD